MGYLSPIPIGIADGMVYVLIASGLALTFGTMRLANMAHGGFFMIGAYLLYTFSRLWSSGLFAVIGGMILAIGGTTILGLVAERVIYRRLYGRPQLSAMLGTFALMLAIQGGVGEIWGINPLSVNYPAIDNLRFVSFGGANIPIYSFVIIGAGLLAMVVLGIVLYKSRLGLYTRAIAMDRHMASLLGIRTRTVFVVSFAIGCALAGLSRRSGRPANPARSDARRGLHHPGLLDTLDRRVDEHSRGAIRRVAYRHCRSLRCD